MGRNLDPCFTRNLQTGSPSIETNDRPPGRHGLETDPSAGVVKAGVSFNSSLIEMAHAAAASKQVV